MIVDKHWSAADYIWHDGIQSRCCAQDKKSGDSKLTEYFNRTNIDNTVEGFINQSRKASN